MRGQQELLGAPCRQHPTLDPRPPRPGLGGKTNFASCALAPVLLTAQFYPFLQTFSLSCSPQVISPRIFCILLLVFKVFAREGHGFYYSSSTTKFLVLSRSRTSAAWTFSASFQRWWPFSFLKTWKERWQPGILHFSKHPQFHFHRFPGRRGNPEQFRAALPT